MKRTIGLAVLMLTGMAAFAQPAAAMDRVVYEHIRRPVIVERRPVVVERRPIVVVRHGARIIRREPIGR